MKCELWNEKLFIGRKNCLAPIYKASFSGRDIYFDPLIDNNMTVSHKSNYLPGDKKELCVDDFSLQREQVDRARQEVIPDRIKSKAPEKSWVLKCLND